MDHQFFPFSDSTKVSFVSTGGFLLDRTGSPHTTPPCTSFIWGHSPHLAKGHVTTKQWQPLGPLLKVKLLEGYIWLHVKSHDELKGVKGIRLTG